MLPPPAPSLSPASVAVWIWHELRLGLPLCTAVALALSLAAGGQFLAHLIYSLCIGLSIQFAIEAGRYGIAAWRRRRDPGGTEANPHWPGWGWMAPWVVLSTVGGYLFGAYLGGLLIGAGHRADPLSAGPRGLAAVMLMSLGVAVAATYFFYSRVRLATTEARAEATRRAAAETQLMLLQSQLEPHMLFNTLANLRVLIGIDPARAQAMLDRLIGFLRATLEASRAGAHPLRAEFDRVADYLALMQVRMGPRLAVRIDLPDDLRDLPVPPLLLQPLVENCIQHGLEPKLEGGRIELGARRLGDRLQLTVRDTGIGLGQAPASAGTGFGLAQVRERLAALFGERATFVLEAAADAEGGSRARIELPIARTST